MRVKGSVHCPSVHRKGGTNPVLLLPATAERLIKGARSASLREESKQEPMTLVHPCSEDKTARQREPH